jgi:hypothetical protein
MRKVYCVYETATNTMHTPRPSKTEAIDDADALANLDQISGTIEVHEFAGDDSEFRNPVVVYSVRA